MGLVYFAGPDKDQAIPQGVGYLDLGDGTDEVWKMELPRGTMPATVRLRRSAGLVVTSNDASVIANPIPETADGEDRLLRLVGLAAGTTMIEVTGAALGTHWAHLQVLVVEVDRTRAPTPGPSQGSGSPSQDGGEATPNPIAELIGMVNSASFKRDGYKGFLNPTQIVNVLNVFLHGHRALVGHKLPERNAIFLPTHTGTETGFGTVGPNAPIGNWFSVQVADPEKTTPLQEAFNARRILTPVGARGNRTSPGAAVIASGVKNPVFETEAGTNVPAMIDAQLELVYGAPKDGVIEKVAPFKTVGVALARTDISAFQFGQEIGRAYAGAGTAEGKAYPARFIGCYDHVIGVLRWFLGGTLAGASATTKTWARATLAGVAPKQ